MWEIKQLSRRAEMVVAGPATVAGGSEILSLIPSLPRCSLFSGEPSGNLGRPA